MPLPEYIIAIDDMDREPEIRVTGDDGAVYITSTRFSHWQSTRNREWFLADTEAVKLAAMIVVAASRASGKSVAEILREIESEV